MKVNRTTAPATPLSVPSATPMKVLNGAAGGGCRYFGSRMHWAERKGRVMWKLFSELAPLPVPGQLISRLFDRMMSQCSVKPRDTRTPAAVICAPPPVIRPTPCGGTKPKSIVRSLLEFVGSVTVAGLPLLSVAVVPAPVGLAVMPVGVATVTVYVPAGRPVNRYAPLPSVVVVAFTGPDSVTVMPLM